MASASVKDTASTRYCSEILFKRPSSVSFAYFTLHKNQILICYVVKASNLPHLFQSAKESQENIFSDRGKLNRRLIHLLVFVRKGNQFAGLVGAMKK
jgi:hypothetical protein